MKLTTLRSTMEFETLLLFFVSLAGCFGFVCLFFETGYLYVALDVLELDTCLASHTQGLA